MELSEGLTVELSPMEVLAGFALSITPDFHLTVTLPSRKPIVVIKSQQVDDVWFCPAIGKNGWSTTKRFATPQEAVDSIVEDYATHC